MAANSLSHLARTTMSLSRPPNDRLRPLPVVPGRWVLIGLLGLVALMAARGNWLVFPMTSAVRGPDLGSGGLVVLVLGALAAWRVSRGAGVLLLCAALAWLASLPLTVAWQHPQWLERYVLEAGDRLQLARFLSRQDVVNLSPDPSLWPVARIAGMGDQLAVAQATMGQAWHVAAFAVVGLIGVALWRRRPARAGLWALLAAVAVGAMLLPPLVGMTRGQWLLESARGRLAAGEGPEALETLQAVPVSNPGALASLPYWLQVELAAAQAEGGRGDAAAWATAMAFLLQPLPPKHPSPYAAVLERLKAQPVPPPPTSPWAARRLAVRDAVRQEVRLLQAWRLREGGDLIGALAALDQAAPAPVRAAWLLWADLRLQQGGSATAEALLGELDRSLAQRAVRAQVACTLGDALTGSGRLLDARRAYLACRDLDESTNFRVLRALGGT